MLQAHLYAPSSAVGFLRPEQPVLLRYEAFPYQKFGHQAGACAAGVAHAAGGGRDGRRCRWPVAAAASRCTASPWRWSARTRPRRPQPLAAGMQLEADVLLERRRLVEWLFEPVLGMAGRL